MKVLKGKLDLSVLICQDKEHSKPSMSEISLVLCIDSVSCLAVSFISVKERTTLTSKCKTKGLAVSYGSPKLSVKISQSQIGSQNK